MFCRHVNLNTPQHNNKHVAVTKMLLCSYVILSTCWWWGVHGGNEDPNDVNKHNKGKAIPVVQLSDPQFGIPLPLDQIFNQISTLPADDMNPEECMGRSELAEYDMCLTQEQKSHLDPIKQQQQAAGKRRKRMASANGFSLWKNGVIPYIFNSSFASTDRDAIINAMSEWEKGTCVRFRPANLEDRDVVIFRDGKRCSTNIGRIGREQAVTLAKSCLSKRILIHELGHVIGLIHEHQRYDRDKYVRVLVENIRNMTQERYQFSKLLTGSMTEKGVRYDYTSVMHYGKNYFARSPGLVTLQPTDARYQDVIGRAEKPSHSDLETVNRLYKCSAGCPNSLRCGPSCFMDSICVCRCRDGADKPFFHGPGPFGNSLPDPTCEFFAAQGECAGNIKDTIRPLCAKSCGLYQPKGNTVPPGNNLGVAPTSISITGVGAVRGLDESNWAPPIVKTNAVNSLQEKANVQAPEPFWNSNLNTIGNNLNNVNGVGAGLINDNNLYSANGGGGGPSVSDITNGFVNMGDNRNSNTGTGPLPPPPRISRAENTPFRQDQNNNYFPLSEAIAQGRYIGSPTPGASTRSQIEASGPPQVGMRAPMFPQRQKPSTEPFNLIMSRSGDGRRARIMIPSSRVRNRAMANRGLGLQRLNYIQRKNTPRGGSGYVSASDLEAILNSPQGNGNARMSKQSPSWINRAPQRQRFKQQQQQQLLNGYRMNSARNQLTPSWNDLNPPGTSNSYDLGMFNPSTFSGDSGWRFINRENSGFNFHNAKSSTKAQSVRSSTLQSSRSGFQTVEEWQKSLNAPRNTENIDPLVSASGLVDSIQHSNRNIEGRPDASINFNQNLQTNSPASTQMILNPSSPPAKPKTSMPNLQGIQNKQWEFQHQQQPMPTVMVDQSVTRPEPPGERHAYPIASNPQNTVSAVMREAVAAAAASQQRSNFPVPLPTRNQQRHHVTFLDQATPNTNRRRFISLQNRPIFNARNSSPMTARGFRSQANAEVISFRQEAPIDQIRQSNTQAYHHPIHNNNNNNNNNRNHHQTTRYNPNPLRQSQPLAPIANRINSFQSFSDPVADREWEIANSASLKISQSEISHNGATNSNSNSRNVHNVKNYPITGSFLNTAHTQRPIIVVTNRNNDTNTFAHDRIETAFALPLAANSNTQSAPLPHTNTHTARVDAFTSENRQKLANQFFNNTSSTSPFLSLFNLSSPFQVYSSARYLGTNPTGANLFSSLIQQRNRNTATQNHQHSLSSVSSSPSSYSSSSSSSSLFSLSSSHQTNDLLNPPPPPEYHPPPPPPSLPSHQLPPLQSSESSPPFNPYPYHQPKVVNTNSLDHNNNTTTNNLVRFESSRSQTQTHTPVIEIERPQQE